MQLSNIELLDGTAPFWAREANSEIVDFHIHHVRDSYNAPYILY